MPGRTTPVTKKIARNRVAGRGHVPVMGERTGTAAIVDPADDAAFAELYRRYHRPVHDFCRRRVANDLVDDAVAETFLAAWRRLDDIPAGGEALLWLYGVAYRVIGHQRRATARRRRLDERLRSVVPRPVSPADESIVSGDEFRRVLRAAARLGDRDAEVLRLVAWERLSVAEVAAVLGIDPNAVKQRLHRARRNLGREYRRLQSRRSTPVAVEGGGQ
jgi:RNA polymerase sigma-70 factor (ECF subfamily)